MTWNPTYSSRQTARDVRAFVKEQQPAFWRILKPLLPGIIGGELLNVLCAIIWPDHSNYMILGSLITAYFLTCLAISWHRVTIHGPHAEPVNPLRPQRHELAFIAMGIVLVLGYTLLNVAGIAISAAAMQLSQLWFARSLGLLAIALCIVGGIYLMLRVTIYFPAKAINNSLTIPQAFRLSKGLVLKLIIAPILASWRVLLAFLGYFIVSAAILVGFLALTEGMDTALQDRLGMLLAAILVLPQLVYFQPVINVLTISCLSNYYLLALERDNDTQGA